MRAEIGLSFQQNLIMIGTVFFLVIISLVSAQKDYDRFMEDVDKKFGEFLSLSAKLGWKGATKFDRTVSELSTRVLQEKAEWIINTCGNVLDEWPLEFQDWQLFVLCRGALPNAWEVGQMSHVMGKLREIYVIPMCIGDVCGKIEPTLAKEMEQSRDPDYLLKVWLEIHNTVGPASKNLFTKLVTISEAGARRNSYDNLGAAWREEIGIPDLENTAKKLMGEVMPLYKSLHAVVRARLREHYGKDYVSASGSIPVHLTGNLWGQSWFKLFDIVYKKKSNFKITEILVEQNKTVDDLVKIVQDFYTSIGFPSLPTAFWENSKWNGSKGVCHASAVNMHTEDDFRILFCADVNEQDFHVFFHEIGHIQYYMAYQHLPHLFQDGVSSAMHEAIGEAVAMAGLAPGNLKRLKLLKGEITQETHLQYLLRFGLRILPQIPFSYVMDKWRWGVFGKTVHSKNYNEVWWSLRRKYQGVMAPVPRNDEDFDAISKYHINNNIPYMRYFIGSILQIQIFENLCNEVNAKIPLHECDLYGQKNSTKKLSQMMAMGRSIDFKTAMKMFVNATVSVKPLLRFFQPLKDWLDKEIEKQKIPVGWDY